jgi:hypothetical protein
MSGDKSESWLALGCLIYLTPIAIIVMACLINLVVSACGGG